MNVRNYIHLTGNLGADPKTHALKKGGFVTKFRLATNEYFRDKEGQRQTRTEWHNVAAYGKLAELFAEHLAKGSQVSLVGSMHYRRWEDKFEQVRYTPEVKAEEFTFLSRGRQRVQAEGEVAVDVATGEVLADLPAGRAERTAAKTEKRRAKKVTPTEAGNVVEPVTT